MSRTQRHTTGMLALSALLIASTALSSDAWAAKKKKGKGKKADTAEVSDADQKAAREHYAKGKALYEEGNFAEALTEFTAAYEAKPHPIVLKSIAECQVQTGEVVAAIETLEKFLADPEADDKIAVQERIDQLRNTPVKVTFTSVPEGAKVVIAGSEHGVTPAELELPPGEHVVTFSVDGYEPLSKSLSVTLGEAPQLGADFASEGVAAGPTEPAIVDPFSGHEEEPTPPAPEIKESNGPPPAFWAMAAVTGVGLITGTVFGTMALSMESDYESNPTTAKQESGMRNAIIADVSFGVAAAAAIAGTVLLVVHNKKSKAPETAADLTVLPTASPETLGLSAVVQF